jgi:energy-coupling factor transporter ATP-binding protein EcfA2
MKILRVTGPRASGKSTLAISQLSEHRDNFLIIGDKSNEYKRTSKVPMNHIGSVAKCDEKDRIVGREFNSLIVDEWDRCLPNLLQVFECETEEELISKIENLGTKRLVIIN